MKNKNLYLVLGLIFLGYHVVAQEFSLPIQLKNRNTEVQLSKWQCYLSNFSFVYETGEVKKEQGYNLLNLTEKDSSLIFKVPNKNLKAISFAIGVDSAQTMLGAFSGDLDPAKGLFWTWQSGYINLKIETESINGEDKSFHIGGYNGNRNTYRTLTYYIPTNQTLKAIQFDLDAFLAFVEEKKYIKVMSPGTSAVTIANHYSSFFNVITK